MMNLLHFNPVILCGSLPASEVPLWHKLAENTVTGVFAMAGIGIAAWLAFLYAIRQKKMETFIVLGRVKYERKLNALEECWKLLAYTTDTENNKSVVIWEQTKEGNKTYYLNKANAQDFITGLAGFFYGTGLGIYLFKEIKELLFEYRGILYGFLLKEKSNPGNVIEIQNRYGRQDDKDPPIVSNFRKKRNKSN